MQFTEGVRVEPQRLVVYGPESIGKTTLASKLPSPVFIDVEGSTSDLDVTRTPTPGSWRALVDLVNEFVSDTHGRQSLVIDSADWAERLCVAHICASHNLTSLGGNEDFGKSYNLLETEWCRFLDSLSRVAATGMHVCLTAHAKMRKFELPDQEGSYDRWELKMERKTASALKEWARTVLFLNYKTYVVGGDKKGDKPKGKGGHRVMYASHHPCWDAKNRASLPDEMQLEFSEIERLFAFQKPIGQSTTRHESPPEQSSSSLPDPPAATPQPSNGRPAFLQPLIELLCRDQITEHELQLAVSKRGYYPVDTPLENYDPQFVAGKLVAYWPQVRGMVDQVRKDVSSI